MFGPRVRRSKKDPLVVEEKLEAKRGKRLTDEAHEPPAHKPVVGKKEKRNERKRDEREKAPRREVGRKEEEVRRKEKTTSILNTAPVSGNRSRGIARLTEGGARKHAN